MRALDEFLEAYKLRRARDDEERQKDKQDTNAQIAGVEELFQTEIARLESRIDDIRNRSEERIAGTLFHFWSIALPYFSTKLSVREIADMYSSLLQGSSTAMTALGLLIRTSPLPLCEVISARGGSRISEKLFQTRAYWVLICSGFP